MTYFSALKQTVSFIFAVALLCTAFGLTSPQKTSAAAETGLCHYASGGVTYKCLENKTEKVDGKAKGTLSTSKCYKYNDPKIGWVSIPCTNPVFTDITVIPQPIRVNDAAAAGGKCPPELIKSDKAGCDLIARYANPLITFLTVAVGLVVTISIVIGGIQYATARNNPQSITAAKNRITNALLGFLAYSLLWGFLQWIIPGGFLK